MSSENIRSLSLFFRKVVPLENAEPDIALAKLESRLLDIRLSNNTGSFVLFIFLHPVCE
jgi:hypothetical protein